jgi:ADP-ribose pyrophosphatase YjhB (NUDIX family)
MEDVIAPREYVSEHGVDPSQVRGGFMDLEVFREAHANLVIPCHDAIINYSGCALLLQRGDVPARGEYFPVGGRINRGLLFEDSLRKKVRAECGLELESIKFLGVSRGIWREDPFGHGKGTDTLSLMYYALGCGEINLDEHHRGYKIVKPEEYDSFRGSLDPWVQHVMDLAMPHFSGK